MGRVGLCTVESYIGGEFFEPNYLDTRDPVLARCFPHMAAPVGGVGFLRIATVAATEWHGVLVTWKLRSRSPAWPVQGAIGRRGAFLRHDRRSWFRWHDRREDLVRGLGG